MNKGKTQNLIIRVKLSYEARFDYEEDLMLGQAPKLDIEKCVSQYIEIKLKEKRELRKIFKIKYFDENSEIELGLFAKHNYDLLNMKYYSIIGICEAEYLDEKYDYEGEMRNWYFHLVDPDKIDYEDIIIIQNEAMKKGLEDKLPQTLEDVPKLARRVIKYGIKNI